MYDFNDNKFAISVILHFRSIVIFFIILSQSQPVWTQELSVDLNIYTITPKQYAALRTDMSIEVDGKANESVWNLVPFTDYFVDIHDGDNPFYGTRVKMLWDAEYFYVFAELEEKHISANITKHDTVVFYDKDFEVFIDPSDDTYHYLELELNANNTTWDLFLDKPYRVGGRPVDNYEFKNIKTAISVEGTLNNPDDEDEKWTIEIAIPIDEVMSFGPRKRSGELTGSYWRVNFSRVHWDQYFEDGIYKRERDKQGELKPEYNWVWSNQLAVNMHQPEFWGYVFFVEELTNEKVGLPGKAEVQQVAYALFRMTRDKEWRNLRAKQAGFQTEISLSGNVASEYATFYSKTNAGFEIIVKELKSNKKWVIDQNGWFSECQ